MSRKQYKMKLIAASLGLVVSVNAYAALGGLQVQSRLNEPFSATVVVTGDEARALAGGAAKPTINGANLNATVTQQSADRAVIRLHSNTPIKEPVMTFWLGVGNQNHQYTAMLDPSDYQVAANGTRHRRDRRAHAEPNRRHSSRHHARSADRREAPIQIQGRSHQIKDGELLVDIAESVKPSGLTLRQTINALVWANPHAFRNGNPDLMYRGATLIIPDAAQLRRLAHNPPRRVTSTRDGQAIENAPAAQQPSVESQNKPAEAQPAVPAPPVEPSIVAEAPQPQQHVPVASEAMAEVPASAALSADQTDMVASMPGQASETEMMVSEPVIEQTPPVVAPPVVETPPMEEEGLDLSQMALYGGGGLLVLGGLAYLLLNRRRKVAAPPNQEESAADDDDFYFESVSDSSDRFAGSPPAPATPARQVAATVAPVEPQPAPVSEQDLGLDLSHLEEQQQLGSTPNTEAVAQQSETDDWSWLEQTDQPAAFQPAPAPVTEVDTASDDAWLNFNSEESVTVPTVTDRDPAPVLQTDPTAEEDLDWVLDETPVDTPPARQAEAGLAEGSEVSVEPPVAIAAETDHTISFEMPDLDMGNRNVREEVSAASNVVDFNLDLDSSPAAPVSAAPVEASQPVAQEEAAPAGSLPQEALEAKLELAKMYLEIDDANTARQTLLELINESEGSSIQARAQALLNDIGQ